MLAWAGLISWGRRAMKTVSHHPIVTKLAGMSDLWLRCRLELL